jgi:hypothetical protein
LDFKGCSARGASTINCNGNGSDEGMPYGDAVGASDCGATARPNQFTTAQFDSIMAGFPSYMSYIPSATCGTVAINTWTTVSTLNTSTPYCGGIKLNNDIVVTGTGNTLTVYDGGINLNGHKISTGTGADLTIIFTGTTHNIPGQKNNDPKWAHNFVGTGVIDIQAPISGNLKGVALMQNPNMAGNADDLDFNYSGNNPELFVSGLWYTPKSNFLIGGSINMHTDGKSCIGVIALTIQTNGTGKIFDHATSECANFVDLPKIPGTNSRQALVQ